MGPDRTPIRQFTRAADDGAIVTIGDSIAAQDLVIAALDREIADRDREIAAYDWAIAAEVRRGTAVLRAIAAARPRSPLAR
jgi:fructose-specific phosphotransferase system component IIB